jgi:type I restriction enzyme S subunit
VAILDEAFAAIATAKANAEKNLKNARELFESYLNGIFEKKGDDWEEKTLKEVCAKITDGTHQTPKYFDKGYVFLSSKNVTSGKIDWENVKYIDEKQHIEMHKRVSPRIGDILLAKNGTTGVAAIVDKNITFDIYVSLAHIRVLDSVLPEYMLYFINSPIAKKQFNKRLKGSGVPNLHLEEIREVLIPFPKVISSQKKIVEKLNNFSEKIEKLKIIYSQKIIGLEELKKSILQKAFSGEFNV